MKEHIAGEENSLWDRLLKSSIKFDGNGCDGIMMNEIEKYTEKILSEINDKDMFKIWEETENGVMVIAQGFIEADRFEMIHDISLDVSQAIVDDICSEAQKILKKTQ